MRTGVYQRKTQISCLNQPSLLEGETISELSKLGDVRATNMQQEHEMGEGRIKCSRGFQK